MTAPTKKPPPMRTQGMTPIIGPLTITTYLDHDQRRLIAAHFFQRPGECAGDQDVGTWLQHVVDDALAQLRAKADGGDGG